MTQAVGKEVKSSQRSMAEHSTSSGKASTLRRGVQVETGDLREEVAHLDVGRVPITS